MEKKWECSLGQAISHAKREDGQFLITNETCLKGAAGLSALPSGAIYIIGPKEATVNDNDEKKPNAESRKISSAICGAGSRQARENSGISA